MLRAALLLSVALMAATPAFAQRQGCRPGLKGVTVAEFVEGRRPVISRRALSNEEKADAKTLVAEVNSALKTNSKTPLRVGTLDRLAAYGASGDKEMMRVLMEGYAALAPVPVTDNLVYDHASEPTWMLAGLWAMRLFEAGDRSKPVSLRLSSCLKDGFSRSAGKCGFEAESPDGALLDRFRDHAKGKGGAPKNVTFTEYKLVQSFPEERTRFEKAYQQYRNGETDQPDRGWAYCWAQRQPSGEYLERWDGSSAQASANYSTTLDNRRIRAQAEIDKKAAEWEALQAKRIAAKSGGTKLDDAQELKWESLSFWLGGKYLAPFASENVLLSETAIDSLCSADSGAACQRQTQLYQARADRARMQQLEQELALRNFKMGGGNVAVRNYDQDGNYLGATTMPAWQADIVGAH